MDDAGKSSAGSADNERAEQNEQEYGDLEKQEETVVGEADVKMTAAKSTPAIQKDITEA